MRARLFAFFILILFILLPTGIYWYFLKKNTSTITFTIPNGGPVSIHLAGTLSYKYFPLADKALKFSQSCETQCTLWPIPPVRYEIQISRPWTADIIDTITLGIGEQKAYTLPRIQEFSEEKIGNLSLDNTPAYALIENAKNHIDPNISLLWILKSGKVFALRTIEKSTDIGALSLENFSPLLSLDFPIISWKLESSKRFFILKKSENEQDIVSINLSESIIFPYPEDIKLIDHTGIWRVVTDTSVYVFEWDSWVKNPRFSDFIDIDPNYRIGYISENDTIKKELGNFTQKWGIFVLLDRRNADIQVLSENKDIIGFLYTENIPTYLDRNGDIYKLHIIQ